MKMQPMETAPRDGTKIILFVEGIFIAGWFTDIGWQKGSLNSHGCGC